MNTTMNNDDWTHYELTVGYLGEPVIVVLKNGNKLFGPLYEWVGNGFRCGRGVPFTADEVEEILVEGDTYSDGYGIITVPKFNFRRRSVKLKKSLVSVDCDYDGTRHKITPGTYDIWMPHPSLNRVVALLSVAGYYDLNEFEGFGPDDEQPAPSGQKIKSGKIQGCW